MIYIQAKRYHQEARLLKFDSKQDLLDFYNGDRVDHRLPKKTNIWDICNKFRDDYQEFRRISYREARSRWSEELR